MYNYYIINIAAVVADSASEDDEVQVVYIGLTPLTPTIYRYRYIDIDIDR